MATILITGSSGFIGGRLFQAMKDQGHRVFGLGRRPVQEPTYVQHDLTAPLALSLRPDVVVHAAALSSPWGSKAAFERHNVLATRHVLDWCRQAGRPRLVFVSSSSVYYRHAHQYDITEDTPLPPRPINRYAASKRRAEALVREYAGDWVIVRPRAVFGPGDTVLFPRILQAARAGRLPLFTTRDGPVLGDLIYIDTLVAYLMTAGLSPEICGCYNLTNNRPVPIQDFLLDVLRRLDIAAPTRRMPVERAMRAARLLEWAHTLFLPRREPPITRFGVSVFAYSKTFDVSRMLADLGPPRVGLEEGVDRFTEWVLQTAPYA